MDEPAGRALSVADVRRCTRLTGAATLGRIQLTQKYPLIATATDTELAEAALALVSAAQMEAYLCGDTIVPDDNVVLAPSLGGLGFTKRPTGEEPEKKLRRRKGKGRHEGTPLPPNDPEIEALFHEETHE